MSIYSIPNQPIIIGQQGNANCLCGDSDYKQIVDENDQLFLQVQLNCFSDAFPQTRDSSNEWSVDIGQICANAQVNGFYKFEFEPDQVYNTFAYTVNVISYTSGTLFVNIQGGQTYEITSAGSFTLYFNTDIMNTDLTPQVSLFGDDFIGCISAGAIGVGQTVSGLFSGHRFFVIDESNNVVIPNADYYQVNENYLTVGFDLSQHESLTGCYRIAYSDECDNVCGQFRVSNGYFTTDSDWTLLAGASINVSQNNLEFDKADATPPRATSATLFCENKEYYVEFKINSITGGAVVAQLGNSALVTGDAVGVFSGTVTSTSGTEFSISLSGGSPIEAVVDYVIVRFSDTQDPKITDVSNELTIGDYVSESPCDTVKLEGCNGNDSFGFKFVGSGFIPGIRVERRFFRAEYQSDIEKYRYASGDSKVTFADVRKVKTLRLEKQPEYVFDFLSLLVYFDSLFIDSVPYELFTDEFPAIEYNDGYDLGAVNLQVTPASGVLRKVDCIGVDPSCLPTVFGNDEPFLLLQNGDRLVLQGGDNLKTQG